MLQDTSSYVFETNKYMVDYRRQRVYGLPSHCTIRSRSTSTKTWIQRSGWRTSASSKKNSTQDEHCRSSYRYQLAGLHSLSCFNQSSQTGLDTSRDLPIMIQPGFYLFLDKMDPYNLVSCFPSVDFCVLEVPRNLHHGHLSGFLLWTQTIPVLVVKLPVFDHGLFSYPMLLLLEDCSRTYLCFRSTTCTGFFSFIGSNWDSYSRDITHFTDLGPALIKFSCLGLERFRSKIRRWRRLLGSFTKPWWIWVCFLFSILKLLN